MNGLKSILFLNCLQSPDFLKLVLAKAIFWVNSFFEWIKIYFIFELSLDFLKLDFELPLDLSGGKLIYDTIGFSQNMISP